MSETLSPDTLVRRNDRLRAWLLLGLLAIVLVAAALVVYLRPHGTGTRIGVGDVLTLVKDKRVTTATLLDEDSLVTGELKPGPGVLPRGGTFSAELPKNGSLTASLTALLAATGAHVDVDNQSGKDHARLLLVTLIPVLALTDLVALVLLTSPYGERLAHLPHPHSPRGRHDLTPVPEPLPPAPAPIEIAPPAATPRKAAPRKTVAKKAPAKVAPRKAAAKRPPAKAQPTEDVLPVKRTTRRTQQ
jgi:hypothetical protein